MTAADRVIRWSIALAVLGVAAVAEVASYEHAYDLVRAHGESGWTAIMVPLTVDGGCRITRGAVLSSRTLGTCGQQLDGRNRAFIHVPGANWGRHRAAEDYATASMA